VTIPILAPVQRWYCPNCRAEDVTHEARIHIRYHTCPKLRNLSAPMVPAGTKAKVEVHEREDYIGRELVRLDDNGRPVMNIITTRDEGQDCMVFAPTATGSGS
jgi:hypothetical protein